MFSHITLGSNDLERARDFYDEVLGVLEFNRFETYDAALGYARRKNAPAWVWIVKPFDGLPATWGNGTHLALLANTEEQVRAFHRTALELGGSDEGESGLRAHYASDYYGAYVRDPDGNKLQAVHYIEGRRVARGQNGFSHITLGTNDIERSRAFYDQVLATLGYERIEDEGDEATAYGVPKTQVPWLYTHVPFDGRAATWGNGTHVAFLAGSRAAVEAFHAKALELGSPDEGAPGPRPHYGPVYYGAYTRDPDGNKIQAACYAAE